MTSSGFDAFFDSVSKSKDFQASVIHNREKLGLSSSIYSKDDPTVFLEAIKQDIEQSESLFRSFQSTFDTKDVREAEIEASSKSSLNKPEVLLNTDQESIQNSQPAKKTGNPNPPTSSIKIERFEVKNPKTH